MIYPSIPNIPRPIHADISNPQTAPALLHPWLRYIASLADGLYFSNGEKFSRYQMLTLNSQKTHDIEDYNPQPPEDPGAQAKEGVRTAYRDAMKAYTDDRQTIATLNNMLLQNMGADDATAIRAIYPNVTTRNIMQYLEDSYGLLGPSHLDFIEQNLLVWDPRLSSRINITMLNVYWTILQYTDRTKFMSLGRVLAAHHAPLEFYNKFVAQNPLATDFAALTAFLNQRLPMGTDHTQQRGAVLNNISASEPSMQQQMDQLRASMEAVQHQTYEMIQRFASIQQISAPPSAPLRNPKHYCFVHGWGHRGIDCKTMKNPRRHASDGQPYSEGMKQSRDGRATPATRNIAGCDK